MQEEETRTVALTSAPTVTEILGRELPTGFGLGSYEIISVLRQNSQSIIYCGRDVLSGSRVTIYENLPTAYANREHNREWVTPLNERVKPDYEAALNDFRSRATAATQLSHPHIAAVQAVFSARGTAYAVAEPPHGTTFAEAMSEPQQVTQAILHPLLYDLLGAVEYMHGHKLVHGHISPHTIRLHNDGTAKLTDFTMMADITGERFSYVPKVDECTPPELAVQGHTPGPWSDLYSLAATCYRLITGERVPRCTDRSNGKATYPPLAERSELKSRFRMEFLQGIDRALELEPQARWQSAQEWRLALGKPTASVVVKHGYKTDEIDLSTMAEPPTTQKGRKNNTADWPRNTGSGRRGMSFLGATLRVAVIALLVSVGGWLWVLSSDILVPMAANGHTIGVKIALSLPGIDPNRAGADGDTPLTAAARSGRADMVWLLLADPRTDVNQADSRGRTPLYIAAENGHDDIVRQLMTAPGIDRCKAAQNELTPARIARQRGHHSIANLLSSDKELALDELRKLGISPHELAPALCRAAAQGELTLLRTILVAGADVNTFGSNGRSPLILAVEGNHVACVQELLSTPGIDPNRGNEEGVSPIWAAALCGHADSLRLLLAAPGINVNWADADGQTALYWAAFNGRTECVRLLLAAPGIEVNKADRNGITPLCRALQGGHTACAKLLRDAGAR